MITHFPGKRHDRAVFVAPGQPVIFRAHVKTLMADQNSGFRHLNPCDRREEGHFVPIGQRVGQLHQRLVHGGQQFAFVQRQRPAVALRRQMRTQGGDIFERAVQRQAVGIDQLTDTGKKSTLIMAFHLKITGFAAAFASRRTGPITISFCTALHMS